MFLTKSSNIIRIILVNNILNHLTYNINKPVQKQLNNSNNTLIILNSIYIREVQVLLQEPRNRKIKVNIKLKSSEKLFKG